MNTGDGRVGAARLHDFRAALALMNRLGDRIEGARTPAERAELLAMTEQAARAAYLAIATLGGYEKRARARDLGVPGLAPPPVRHGGGYR